MSFEDYEFVDPQGTGSAQNSSNLQTAILFGQLDS